MGKRRANTDCWYKMPKDWRHLRDAPNPQDKTIGIKDEHYKVPEYRTCVRWEQLDGEGVFTLVMVLEANGRTEREVEADVVQYARSIWQFKRHLCVADHQGINGQTNLYLGFRLPSMPTVQEVERLYRLIKGFSS